MPALTNIGGFYASLGLQPDKNSFENGMKLIGNTSDSLSKLIGVARNAAVVLAMDKLGTSQTELARTSEKLGVSTEAIKVWSTAAKVAGVSADGVVSSMSKLGRTLEKQLFDASGVKTLQDAIWKLGISFEEIKDMTGDNAFKYILEKAQSLADIEGNTTVAWKLEEALGSEAADLFIELQKTGKTISQFLDGSSNFIYTNESDDKAFEEFTREVNTLKTAVTNIGKALGIEGGKLLTPYIENINKWLGENGKTIESGIKNIFGTLDGVIKSSVEGLSEWWDTNGDNVRDTISDIFVMITSIFGWLNSKEGKSVLKKTGQTAGEIFSTTGEMLKAIWQGRMLQVPEYMWQGYQNIFDIWTTPQKANDGILRPDGTLTQVAPDDWVFAVRNVGDLAKAFIPQGETPNQITSNDSSLLTRSVGELARTFIPQGMTQNVASTEYSIVQNFTITGSSDIPQVLKSQAYNGVQEGLAAVMAQSSQRFQYMSGTR